MSKENNVNGVLLGMAVGGAIGFISALLLAPKSGTQLREDLSTKFQSITGKTKDVAATVGKNLKELAGTLKEEATDVVDQAKRPN
ncbi:YtxH domain-containing protein [Cohnella soli]|uniref:YtxH domain-containing protein n=1 Tax=Cohnella soli TaxID=425005 RepID=A0ABW0I0F7_9BACL